jgi:iron-sulfur cluster repair protein YtfE (RIC family)
MSSQPVKSLLDLNKLHHELDQLFFEHQVALLKGDFSRSRAMLKPFEKALLQHMKEEDEILLPLYRQRADQIQGGDAEIFLGEHVKITEWINRINLRASRLNRSDANWKEIISLFDDEAQFKKYVEHHSIREDRIFYPEVDRVVEGKEKEQVMRLLTFTLEEFKDIEDDLPPTSLSP